MSNLVGVVVVQKVAAMTVIGIESMSVVVVVATTGG
jgi:hypothetical protein